MANQWARLAYSNSFNLGDMIQTLATEAFIGCDSLPIERHELSQYKGVPVSLIMQGYFFNDDFHCTFPPSEKIKPFFFGFHIEDTPQNKVYFSSQPVISYLKRHQPIGCRDKTTADFLKEFGVDSYFSRCLTLTFPRRDNNRTYNKIFFIDPPDWLTPRRLFGGKFNELYKSATHLSQVVDPKFELSDSVKREMALERLNTIKNEAKLVVTSRLHVAAPCLGMGVPVVIMPRTTTPSRYETIEGLSKIYWAPTKTFAKYGFIGKYLRLFVRVIYVRYLVDWNPAPPDIEKEKKNIIMKLNSFIHR